MTTLAAPAHARRIHVVPLPLRNLRPALRACLTFGIDPVEVPADDPSWAEDLFTIETSKLGGVALEALGQAPGRPSAMVVRHLRDNLKRYAMLMMGVEHSSAGALQALAEARIDFVIVKGPAMARHFPDPRLRIYTDLDLVISPRQFSLAMHLLSSVGYECQRHEKTPWNWVDRHCIEGINAHHPRGGNIDIHHHIAPWVWSRKLTHRDLLERSEPGSFAGVPVRYAGTADCLVIAGMHVVNDLYKGDASLASWRDLVWLTSRLGPDEVRRAFASAGIEWFLPVVLGGSAFIRDPLQRDEVSPLSWPKRTRLRALGWDGSTVAARHPVGWALRLPMARAIAFIVASALPSRSYIRAKGYRGYRSYWSESLVTLTRAARGVDYRQRTIAERNRDRAQL